MPRRRHKPGLLAIIECKTRMLHPIRLVKEKLQLDLIPSQHKTRNLVIVRKEVKTVNRENQECYILHHPDFINDDGSQIELHAVCCKCKVTQPGPPEHYFDRVVAPPVAEQAPPEETPPNLPDEVINFRPNDNEALLRNHGIFIAGDDLAGDDNNENEVPAINRVDDMYGPWGFTGFCERRAGHLQFDAKLTNYNGNFDYQTLFEHFFPIAWVTDVLLVETNRVLRPNLSYGEFLRWYGIWLVMAATEGGCLREQFWDRAAVSMFRGAPYRFNEYMSQNRFNNILSSLSYTTQQYTNADKFWEVREMIEAWNENMTNAFRPSWISCLDESMSPWTNPFSCPGYMYVPRKPHPYGNEYHTVCCGRSRILWGIEMVEGKDAPRGRVKEFEDRGGPTVGLLLRLMKPFFYTGMALVLDSGFCVLKALVELRKVGIFAAAVIKKRRYWPKYIRGDEIAAHFEGKPVGSYDYWPGMLDNVKFSIHCLKEPDYVMSLMATYGTDQEMGEDAKRTITTNTGQTVDIPFKYKELFYYHFKYRNAVDQHNQNRHKPLSLEEIWATIRWPNRVFAFLLSITEVNVKVAAEYFGKKEKLPMLHVRRLIAEALINNTALIADRENEAMNLRPVLVQHTLETFPFFKRWDGRRFVPANTQFPQKLCMVCNKKRSRKYCSCTPTSGCCDGCHAEHVLLVHTVAPHGH